MSIPLTVLEWSRSLANLSPSVVPCRGLRPDEWRETHQRCQEFVERWGVQAHERGWDTLRLFGVDPKYGRVRGDWCGVLIPLVDDVTEVTSDMMRVGSWRVWKTIPVKQLGAVAIWDFER